MIGIQAASRLYARTGPRRLMTAGLLAAAVPITLMSTLGPGDASWAIPGLMFVTGLLFGFSAGPAQTASLATISMAQTGQVMTLFNVQRQAGPRGRAGTRRARPPLSAALSWRGD